MGGEERWLVLCVGGFRDEQMMKKMSREMRRVLEQVTDMSELSSCRLPPGKLRCDLINTHYRFERNAENTELYTEYYKACLVWSSHGSSTLDG